MINLYSSNNDSTCIPKYTKSSQLCGHAKGISDFVWSSDSNYICSCSDNQLIIMWDIQKSKPIQLFPTPSSLHLSLPSISSISNLQNQSQQYQYHQQDTSALFLYDIFIENQISSSLHKIIKCKQKAEEKMKMKMNAQLKNENNNNNDISSSSHNLHSHSHSHSIENSCLSSSKSPLSSQNSSPNMFINSLDIMNNNNNNLTHNHYILCLSLNKQGNIIASGSFDETIILWDVRSGKYIKILSAHSDPVCCLSFVNDGTMLLSAGYDGLIRGWNMSSRRCIKTLGFDPTPISFAKWTPNGQYIISGTLNNTIRIWDFQTAKTVKTFKGHKNEKFCLFSDFININNIHCIVCGSEDGYIYFWDIDTKEIIHKLKAHNDVVIATNFKPKSSNNNDILFASGGLQNDNTVKLWQIV